MNCILKSFHTPGGSGCRSMVAIAMNDKLKTDSNPLRLPFKVVDLLVYLQGERGNYTEKKVLQALIYRLNLVKNDLDKLGKDKVLSE